MGTHGNSIANHWYVVSSHGAVLFYIAVNPDCTIREIADEMSLTQRTVWASSAICGARTCLRSAVKAAATTTP